MLLTFKRKFQTKIEKRPWPGLKAMIFTHTVVTSFFFRQVNEFFSSTQGVSCHLDSEDLKFDDKPSNLTSQFRPHNIFTSFFHEKKEKRHVLVEFCTVNCSYVDWFAYRTDRTT